jgi:hypothetical protein
MSKLTESVQVACVAQNPSYGGDRNTARQRKKRTAECRLLGRAFTLREACPSMKPTRALVVLSVAATGTLPAHAEAPQPRSEIRNETRHHLELRAHFFRHATGKFDTEDATTVGGWNTFISSEAVLVLVTISGPSFPRGRGASLHLLARSGRQVLARKWLSLRYGYFSESGEATIPFLIHGAGVCNTIEVDVVLQVGGRRQKLRREIPLACGE